MLPSRLLLCISLLFFFAACAPTKQARSVEPSGFLGDLYPLMHKGAEGEALLLYRNAKVDAIPRGTYKKLLLDHAQVWGEPTADPARLAQSQNVANLLYSLTFQSLAKDYEMVTEPGPGTLHIQAAITRADPAYVVLRAISTVPAPMNAFAVASALKNLGLGASADRRVGNKRLDADSFDSWDDVHKTLIYWSEQIRYRLCKERGGQNCVPAKG